MLFIWINNSKTTLILMLFLSSLDNFLYDAHNIFQKDVDNFELWELFGVGGAVPPQLLRDLKIW